jgi:glycosyltransferase involved in cell wall biosynthesis
MASGLPVVAFDIPGMAEAVTDSVQGFLVPSRDWRFAADALEKLARQPEIRSRMGDSGKAQVARRFTLERHSREFARLILDVATGDKEECTSR